MSTATDMAELEGAIAEAELTEAEAAVVKEAVQDSGVPVAEAVALVLEARAGELEPAAQPAAPGDLTEQDFRDLDKAKAAHLRKVRGIIGELGAELEECPTCEGMGLAEPRPAELELKGHEYFVPCETCNALGSVLTGSKVPGEATRKCPACGGRGYLEALDQTGAPIAGAEGNGGGPTLVAPVVPADLLEPGAGLAAQASRFGRPAWMGDPSVGQ